MFTSKNYRQLTIMYPNHFDHPCKWSTKFRSTIFHRSCIVSQYRVWRSLCSKLRNVIKLYFKQLSPPDRHTSETVSVSLKTEDKHYTYYFRYGNMLLRSLNLSITWQSKIWVVLTKHNIFYNSHHHIQWFYICQGCAWISGQTCINTHILECFKGPNMKKSNSWSLWLLCDGMVRTLPPMYRHPCHIDVKYSKVT